MRMRSTASGLAALAAAATLVAGAHGAPPSPKKPLTVEAIAAQPPIVSRPAEETAWRTARKLTWLVAEGAGRRAPTSLWEYDLDTGKKTKLSVPLEVPAETPSNTAGTPPDKGK